ncbi:MAG: DUF523 domain-containing protein [Ruminococcaceae bacterium]|nr:DUF523 domain-containing protein [Oscillospiraceae bacterium]
MKQPLLISECLLGAACRYDGNAKALEPELLSRLMARWTLVPVCPEQLGGLETPRPPAERQGDRVVANTGRDVTAQYRRGAAQALYLAKLFGAKTALLKERSPSCGRGTIYDGSFSGALTPGDGVTAELLAAEGISVFGESEVEKLL